MTEQENTPAPQTPAPAEAPRTGSDQSVTESQRAAQGEIPVFFGSGTVEAPAGQAAPDVAPTATPTQSATDSGSSSSDSGSSGDGS
jgi:hypothetical protein